MDSTFHDMENVVILDTAMFLELVEPRSNLHLLLRCLPPQKTKIESMHRLSQLIDFSISVCRMHSDRPELDLQRQAAGNVVHVNIARLLRQIQIFETKMDTSFLQRGSPTCCSLGSTAVSLPTPFLALIRTVEHHISWSRKEVALEAEILHQSDLAKNINASTRC